MDILVAVLLAVAFSILISVIQVKSSCGSKASYRACTLTGSFLLYLLILIIGNTATTLLASATITFAAAAKFAWFWYAFIGVFGFEILLKNMNLTFADRDVLSINDWITKARDNAVQSALEAQINLDEQVSQKLANDLLKLPEKELDTYIANMLGHDVLHRLQRNAKKQNVDFKLIKALFLAKQEPLKAVAITRARRR
ncbi:MAG TPA: hypothetical protein VNK49_03100 [Anaerolineales bacterium]|nr:hypothetical protein [Anaerolineales bacterium]